MTLSARELALLANTDVLGYIQARNAERNAQALAEGWEFWTLMSEELASEFSNVYELELMFARGAYTDAYKDWCGCKGYVSDELTLEQVEAEADRVAEWAAEEWKAEQEWRKEEDRRAREEIALGVVPPTPEVELEQWEVYEAKAEAAGYGA